jgi:hypothetical protein
LAAILYRDPDFRTSCFGRLQFAEQPAKSRSAAADEVFCPR